MKKYLVMIILVVSIITGCKNTLKEGKIYEKSFAPEYYETILVPYTYYDGKSGSMIMMPTTIYHPESWKIKIRSYNEEKQQYDTATYYVDKDTFEQCNIGDIYQSERKKRNEDTNHAEEGY